MKRVTLSLAALLLGTIALSGCGSSSSGGAAASDAKGPIKIWYSNNEQEVAWGKQAVAAWNKLHTDQVVTAEEIPAGKSSEDVITAAISREVRRNISGAGNYRPFGAHRKALGRRPRPRSGKLAHDPELRDSSRAGRTVLNRPASSIAATVAAAGVPRLREDPLSIGSPPRHRAMNVDPGMDQWLWQPR